MENIDVSDIDRWWSAAANIVSGWDEEDVEVDSLEYAVSVVDNGDDLWCSKPRVDGVGGRRGTAGAFIQEKVEGKKEKESGKVVYKLEKNSVRMPISHHRSVPTQPRASAVFRFPHSRPVLRCSKSVS
jgi:hypothetical protein